MYILRHYDWYGPREELEEITEKWKKFWDGSDGVKYIGRFAPHNKKYHFTDFIKVKDMQSWVDRKRPTWYTRDYKVHTHLVMETYTET